jgi:hypothetical protein
MAMTKESEGGELPPRYSFFSSRAHPLAALAPLH